MTACATQSSRQLWRTFFSDSSASFFLVCGLNTLSLSTTETIDVAARIQDVCRPLGLPLVFKGSFDKANRTSAHGDRGPGILKGMEIFATLREEFPNLLTMTDVHEPWQAKVAVETGGLSALQVPAMLCRQTDLIVAAALQKVPILIKRGQFASAEVMAGAVEKARTLARNDQVIVCERGTVGTGIGDAGLVADPRSLRRLKESCLTPVVMDITHASQQPPDSGTAKRSAGTRSDVAVLGRMAAAVGFDGIFIEVHPRVEEAKADATLQWPLDGLKDLLVELCDISKASNARRGSCRVEL